MLASFSMGMAGSASAQAKPSDDQQSPCTTKIECDTRADQRDTEARSEAWNATVRANETSAETQRQLRAAALNRAEGGKLSRVQEVMRRRREAAARAGN